jgi:eukaryotic-like serine/threonine-protein kinase
MAIDRPETSSVSLAISGETTDSFLRDVAAVTEAPSVAFPVLPFEAGQTVAGRFVIERRAGGGGMGTVYRALDLSTGKAAAVKVIATQSRSVAQRFRREAVVLAELRHPRIVRYLSHGLTVDGLPFLAMDWLEGEDLSVRLARSGFDARESLSLVRRASEGLAVAHAQGVVHRDVKPSNLFLVDCDPTQIQVIDFGVAHVDQGTGAFTRPGTVIGTAGYMAPEQVTGATDVDARADVYSLGCVLFECLTGRPPWVGGFGALLVQVLREEPPRPSTLRPDLSEEADLLLARLLAKDRERRPRDAGHLLGVLDAAGALVR